jgi:adenosylhomocysteine nucleosidase
MIAMTAATGQEIDAVSRCFRKRRLAVGGCTVWRGTRRDKEILVLQTGIGRDMAERSVGTFLTVFKPDALISLGFGGALNGTLAVGDLVLCASAAPGDGTGDALAMPGLADDYLMQRAIEAAQAQGSKWLAGSSVTVARLASEPSERRALAGKVRAEVCEMEDYWLARAAVAGGIPFLAVRVIYDELNATLPAFDRMVDRFGNVRLGRTAAYLVAHPRQLGRMWGSYRDCCRAKESLSLFIEKLLDIL